MRDYLLEYQTKRASPLGRRTKRVWDPVFAFDGIEYRGIPSTSVICRLQVGTTVWHQLRGRGQISEVLSNSVKPYVVRYDSGQVTLSDPSDPRVLHPYMQLRAGPIIHCWTLP